MGLSVMVSWIDWVMLEMLFGLRYVMWFLKYFCVELICVIVMCVFVVCVLRVVSLGVFSVLGR